MSATHRNPDPFEYDFPESSIQELRKLLGSKLERALPSLKFVANLYVSVCRLTRTPSDVRREVAKLLEIIEKAETAIEGLSPDARQLLRYATDLDASSGADTPISAYYTLTQTAATLKSARLSVRHLCKRPRNSPATLLASGVAGSLAFAGVPLSKGRDGLFARVLSVVWYALEPDRAPVEIFPYIRAAVDIGLNQNPELKVRRGRPRK